MRIFFALVVFAFGVGLYAAAALLFDRRRVLRRWQAARRARTTGQGSVVAQSINAVPIYLVIAGCLILGTLLMLGSCAGVIVW